MTPSNQQKQLMSKGFLHCAVRHEDDEYGDAEQRHQDQVAERAHVRASIWSNMLMAAVMSLTAISPMLRFEK